MAAPDPMLQSAALSSLRAMSVKSLGVHEAVLRALLPSYGHAVDIDWIMHSLHALGWEPRYGDTHGQTGTSFAVPAQQSTFEAAVRRTLGQGHVIKAMRHILVDESGLYRLAMWESWRLSLDELHCLFDQLRPVRRAGQGRLDVDAWSSKEILHFFSTLGFSGSPEDLIAWRDGLAGHQFEVGLLVEVAARLMHLSLPERGQLTPLDFSLPLETAPEVLQYQHLTDLVFETESDKVSLRIAHANRSFRVEKGLLGVLSEMAAVIAADEAPDGGREFPLLLSFLLFPFYTYTAKFNTSLQWSVGSYLRRRAQEYLHASDAQFNLFIVALCNLAVPQGFYLRPSSKSPTLMEWTPAPKNAAVFDFFVRKKAVGAYDQQTEPHPVIFSVNGQVSSRKDCVLIRARLPNVSHSVPTVSIDATRHQCTWQVVAGAQLRVVPCKVNQPASFDWPSPEGCRTLSVGFFAAGKLEPPLKWLQVNLVEFPNGGALKVHQGHLLCLVAVSRPDDGDGNADADAFQDEQFELEIRLVLDGDPIGTCPAGIVPSSTLVAGMPSIVRSSHWHPKNLSADPNASVAVHAEMHNVARQSALEIQALLPSVQTMEFVRRVGDWIADQSVDNIHHTLDAIDLINIGLAVEKGFAAEIAGVCEDEKARLEDDAMLADMDLELEEEEMINVAAALPEDAVIMFKKPRIAK